MKASHIYAFYIWEKSESNTIVMNSTKRSFFASASRKRKKRNDEMHLVEWSSSVRTLARSFVRSVLRNAPGNLFRCAVKTKVYIPREMGKLCGPTTKGITRERYIATCVPTSNIQELTGD